MACPADPEDAERRWNGAEREGIREPASERVTGSTAPVRRPCRSFRCRGFRFLLMRRSPECGAGVAHSPQSPAAPHSSPGASSGGRPRRSRVARITSRVRATVVRARSRNASTSELRSRPGSGEGGRLANSVICSSFRNGGPAWRRELPPHVSGSYVNLLYRKEVRMFPRLFCRGFARARGTPPGVPDACNSGSAPEEGMRHKAAGRGGSGRPTAGASGRQ